MFTTIHARFDWLPEKRRKIKLRCTICRKVRTQHRIAF